MASLTVIYIHLKNNFFLNTKIRKADFFMKKNDGLSAVQLK